MDVLCALLPLTAENLYFSLGEHFNFAYHSLIRFKAPWAQFWGGRWF
jgi:hypothetical protein